MLGELVPGCDVQFLMMSFLGQGLVLKYVGPLPTLRHALQILTQTTRCCGIIIAAKYI
jgi:hypothetical protein